MNDNINNGNSDGDRSNNTGGRSDSIDNSSNGDASQVNGRSWQAKLADKVITKTVDNWGAIVKYGVTLTFAVWLLSMFQFQYVADREAARDEQRARVESLEKSADSYRLAFDKVAEVMIAGQKRQDMANAKALSFFEDTSKLHDQQIKLMTETHIAIKNAEKCAHDERMTFWQPTAKLLGEMKVSDEKREQLQKGMLEQLNKLNVKK